MAHVVICEGDTEINKEKDNIYAASTFYRRLHMFYVALGQSVLRVTGTGEHTLEEVIKPETHTLIGHSRGASWIGTRFISDLYPHVKSLVLFDPNKVDYQLWYSLTQLQAVFLSTEWQEKFRDMNRSRKLDGGHYFLDHELTINAVLATMFMGLEYFAVDR